MLELLHLEIPELALLVVSDTARVGIHFRLLQLYSLKGLRLCFPLDSLTLVQFPLAKLCLLPLEVDASLLLVLLGLALIILSPLRLLALPSLLLFLTVLEVGQLLLQAMHLDAEAHEVSIDIDGLLGRFLTLEGVPERQVRIHVLLVGGDGLLEHVLRDVVLGLDVVHDGRVVEEHAVGGLEVKRSVVVGQGVLELTGPLHVDAKVVVDLGLILRGLQRSLVERMCLLVAALLLEENGEIAARLEVIRLCLQSLLVVVLRPLKVTDLLVDVAEVEQRRGVLLLRDGDLEVVNGPLRVLSLLEEHDADIEVGLEVLRVSLESPLVVRQALVKVGSLTRGEPQVLDTCGDRVERVDILSVMFENREIDLFLYGN